MMKTRLCAACICALAACSDGGDINEPVEHGIPAGYPALGTRIQGQATWHHDSSGFPDIPNEVFASVDDIPVAAGTQTVGFQWVPEVGAYGILFNSEDVALVVWLRSLDVGTYQVTGFDGQVE